MQERRNEATAMREATIEQNKILQTRADEQLAIQREAVTKQREAATQARELATGVAGGSWRWFRRPPCWRRGAGSNQAGRRSRYDTRPAQSAAEGFRPASDATLPNPTRDTSSLKTHAGTSEADWMAAYKDARVNAPDDAQNTTELFARYRSCAPQLFAKHV